MIPLLIPIIVILIVIFAAYLHLPIALYGIALTLIFAFITRLLPVTFFNSRNIFKSGYWQAL